MIQENNCTRMEQVSLSGRYKSNRCGFSHRIYFLNNTATYNGRKNTAGGGGPSVGSGASAMITSPSLFQAMCRCRCRRCCGVAWG